MKSSKITARLLSVVLAVMMLFSLVTVGFTSTSAANVEIAETGASIPAGTYLYLKPSANWAKDGARFAAYFFGNGEAWVSMTKVESTGNGVYRVQSPADKAYTNVIFCRMNPGNNVNDWGSNGSNKWNQTSDLTWDGTNNCYAVKENTWDKGGGTWSVYADSTLVSAPTSAPEAPTVTFQNTFGGTGTEADPYLVTPAEKTTMIVSGKLGDANGLAYNVNYTASKVDWTVGATSVLYSDLSAPALDETLAVNVYLWAYNKAGSVVKYSADYATTTVYIKGYEQADTPDTPVVDNSYELGYQKVDGLYAYAATVETKEELGANGWQRWHENSDGRNFYLPGSASDTEVIVLNTYSSQVLLNGVIIPAGEYAVVPYESGTSYVCSGATNKTVTIYKTDAEGTIFLNAQNGTTTKNDDKVEATVDATYDLYAFLTSGSKNQEAGNVAGAVASAANGVIDDITPDTPEDGADIKKIKGRGNSTWNLAKKPFNITYYKNVTIDGMNGKKWSLLANAQDSSLLRNRLVYDLANEVGMHYACDSRFVDMFVNGYYQGSYQLTQKIEMGKNTVMPDLEEPIVEVEEEGDVVPTDNFDFILELDTAANAANAGDLTFTTELGQVMTHKVPDEPTDEQVAFMKAKYQAVEKALYEDDLATLATLVDINDFARAYLVNEVAKNLDAGVTSCYFVYDSDNNIFYMSPVWDYDNALGNSHSIPERHDADGKMLDLSRPDGWYAKELMHFDANFKGGRSVFSEACYMTSKTADGKTFMDIVKDVWTTSFAGVADVLTGDAQASSRLQTLDGYLASLANSGNWNYGKGWQLSNNKNNSWIADHSSLVMYTYDAEANTLATSNKTYDQETFEGQAAYAADWMLSRINWMSAQFADAETVVPEGFVTVYFTNNWNFETQNVYWFGGTTAATPTWPGITMTFVETNDNGENVYCANVPADADGIIFSGINDQDHTTLRQTVDITEFAQNSGFYCVSEKDSKIEVGTWTYTPPVEEETTAPVEDPTTEETTAPDASEDESEPTTTEPVVEKEYITVYFTNNWAFKNVDIHYWGGFEGTEWPGTAMTFVEINGNNEAIYSAEIPADTTGLLFRGEHDQQEGVMRQTADITEGIVDGAGWYCVEEVDGKINVGTYTYVPTPDTTDDEQETTAPDSSEDDSEPTTTEPVVEPEYITIYFSNAWAWKEVSVHYWGSNFEADTSWPGKAMTYLETNEYDQDIYTATIPADVDGINFTGLDGETLKQSANITPEDGYGYYMDWSEEEGEHTDKYVYVPTPDTTDDEQETTVPEETTTPEDPATGDEPDLPTLVTVYAINSANWADVYAYVWDGNGTDNTWPGVAMEKNGETINGADVYAISFDSKYVNLLFNNNDKGSQTENLTTQADKYYDIKAQTWYDSLEDVPAVDPLSTDVYLVGSFNGWSTIADEFKLTEEGAATAVVTVDLEAAKDYEFKIVRNGAWTAPKTATTITDSVAGLVFSSSGVDNVKLTTTEAGTYTFTWTISESKLAVQYPGTEVPEEPTPDEPIVDTTVKLAGSFTDWATGAIEMTLVEGSTTVYTTEVKLAADTYEFKIVEFGTWLGNTGTIENTAEGWTFKNKDAEGNDVGNCTLKATGGTYTFIFDSETDKVTITAVLDEIVTTPDEPAVKYFTVIYLNADGKFLGFEQVEEGKAAAGIEAPTMAADAQYTYTFAGWDADLDAITADTIATAKYDTTVNKYTVTFTDKDGAVLDTQTVEYGAAATAPEAP
ncbi:MAG: CotH kinase family protein, partial [Ruminococcus sp.]|nr:CotH kinase family protein [Ruminococcus sp.]